MNNQDVLASGAMGLLFGLFAFAAGFVRVRYWGSRRRQTPLNSSPGTVDARYSPGRVAPSLGSELRAALGQLLAFDRLMDLVAVLFVIAMLLYGAWVVPRLRLVLAVAVATAMGCTLVWLKAAKWLARRRH